MAQLAKIEAVIEQRWGKKKESEEKKDRDEEEGSKNGPRESQEEGTLLFTFCQNS